MIINRTPRIDTKRLIIAGTLLLTSGLLYVGVYNPQSFIMGFADASTLSTILRSVVVVVLVAILISRPPRSMVFRFMLGAVSLLILGLSFISMMSYHIGVLDVAIYLEVSIIFALEALEYDTIRQPARQMPYSPAKS
jgi:hypothetical protein